MGDETRYPWLAEMPNDDFIETQSAFIEAMSALEPIVPLDRYKVGVLIISLLRALSETASKSNYDADIVRDIVRQWLQNEGGDESVAVCRELQLPETAPGTPHLRVGLARRPAPPRSLAGRA